MADVSLEQARASVLAACPRLHPRALPLESVAGCVTSMPVVAEEQVPPFANTAMDGFAVRAADTVGAPVQLRVVGTLAAGAAPDQPVGQGEAVRIMTGAPIPRGADAVVMVERTSSSDDGAKVEVQVEARPGDHVRPAGDDVQPGQVVVPADTVLTPAHLGVLASLGVRRVPVYPRVRVGVLSTGDELVDAPPGELQPGQIRDANRIALLTLVADAGWDGIDLGVVRDDEAAITAAIEDGVARCDALITSGGVSVGDFDYVKAVLDRLGEMTWMQVAIRPAKPLAFGTVGTAGGAGTVPVFGLPGNPVSSLVSFELFARPALRQMTGHAELFRATVPAVADDGLARRPDGRTHFVRAVASVEADGRFHVRSIGGQGSHQLTAMAAANALAVVPDGDGVAPGATVDTLLLSYP